MTRAFISGIIIASLAIFLAGWTYARRDGTTAIHPDPRGHYRWTQQSVGGLYLYDSSKGPDSLAFLQLPEGTVLLIPHWMPGPGPDTD